MNIVLWVLQIFLAGMFVMSGVMKSTRPKEALATKMPWVEDFSPGMVRFIGIAEVLGGIGLILPAVTGVAKVLTPLAATGIAVIMLLAALIHVRRQEPKTIPVNVVVLVLAALVAWGRFGPYAL
jgi:uncharacterized membrane protein YphA (DoxX/SURF4 family)